MDISPGKGNRPRYPKCHQRPEARYYHRLAGVPARPAWRSNLGCAFYQLIFILILIYLVYRFL